MPKSKSSIIQSSPANHAAYGDCPECNASLYVKHVGKNSFVACSNYPTCSYTSPINKTQVTEIKRIEGSSCPLCESTLAIKNGRFGMFIGCTSFPDCDYISDTHTSPSNDSFKPADCPECGVGKLIKKQNRFGKFFYACSNYPKCQKAFNSIPIAVQCSKCKYPIMLKKSTASNELSCASPSCDFITKE